MAGASAAIADELTAATTLTAANERSAPPTRDKDPESQDISEEAPGIPHDWPAFGSAMRVTFR